MKKFLSYLLLVALITPQIAFANSFKPATLYLGKDLKKVTSQVQSQKLFKKGYKLYKGQQLGSQVVTDFSVRLSASITTSQATIPVTSMVTKDGHTLTIIDFGATAYLTVEPGSSREEIVKCTGISGNQFTGCTRGLAFYGTSTAAVTANQFSHQSGSSVILSNVHYVYLGYADLDTAQTFTGKKTFATTTQITVSPLSPTDIANKGYVDGVAIAGAPNMSDTVKGIAKMSSTPSSSTNPIVLNSEEVSTTSSANKVVRASSTGFIDNSWLNLFNANNNWIGTNTFSGTLVSSGPTIGFYQIFGDGSDGATTTFGIVTLTRDMYYSNLTISTTSTIITAGYRIYVSGSLINNGTISNNGANGLSGAFNSNGGAGAGGVTVGAGGSGGAGAGGASYAWSGGGGGGGGGVVWMAVKTIIKEGTTTAVGGNGGSGTNNGGSIVNASGSNGASISKTLIPTNGGQVSGGSVTGFASSLCGATTQTLNSFKNIFSLSVFSDYTSGLPLSGGPGGGGGGSTTTSIQAGGGGGGGGGVIFKIYSSIQTIGVNNVSGGSGGAGAGGGSGGSSGPSGTSTIITM